MSMNFKKRRHPTASSPHESDDDTGEQASTSSSQITNKRRGSVAADFAPHRPIVSERQQMAILKQLTAGDESNTGSQSPSSLTPQPRPSKINRRNEHGETIVHIAARKGDLKQLKKVLKAGANVNEADNAGWTPLHEAVTKNQFKAARLLLKSGAYSNAPGPEGQTPLVDAVLNNNTKMAELLMNYSADPSVVDLTRLNETMSKVLKREMSVLDSSDNENDDESTSPLSPLTSDNDFEHEDKQNFHSTLVEKLDKNLLQPSTTTSKLQHKTPYHRFRERSSQSSDSSPHSKTRTISGNNETSTTTAGKNPYDFESEEEGEIREPSSNEIPDEQKKKSIRKQEPTKQQTSSENPISTSESSPLKKRPNKIDLNTKDSDQMKFESLPDEKQLQHIYRVPPLKIVLARAVLQKTPETESSMNPPSMDDEDTNDNCLTIDTSLSIPTIEANDKLLSSLSSNIPMIITSNIDREDNEDQDQDQAHEPMHEENSSSQISLPESESIQSQSPQTVSSNILEMIINQIESDNSQLNSLAIVEDDQNDVEDDEEDEEDNEEDEDEPEEQDNADKSSTNKTNKIEKEHSTNKSTLVKGDFKTPTRTLRSHARKKINLTMFNPVSSNANNNTRRVSNRRRALDNKLLLAAHEKDKKRKTLAERMRKEKDSTQDEVQTSSNSDDQTTEMTHMDKATNSNDDASSCSSTGAGDGSSTSSSTANTKQTNPPTDIDFLPPNKRRLRERNAAFLPTSTTDPSTHSDHSSVETTTTNREIPPNSIKQFLEIRQQIAKRHDTMLHDYVLPKFPKDFSETTMARKSYLVAPAFISYSSTTTPAAIGIRRYAPPDDLDPHLAEVFAKQEDERYRMKLRHQVERDKLILSYEQEVLRLCGNATRSSMNQEIPFSYCSLLKDDEVYNNPSTTLPEKLITSDYNNTELGKRGKHRWNGRSYIKWLEDSNLKYKRLSCELNERQRLEAETLYSMQRMVWLKHLPKESANSSALGRTSYLLTERYLPKVDINSNFWTNWETSPFN